MSDKSLVKTPQDCSQFESCSAPLCPLDPDIEKRFWYMGEDICTSHKFGKHRWIKKQRLIARRKTRKYDERPVFFTEFYDISRPRKMSDEDREAMLIRLSKLREKIGRAK